VVASVTARDEQTAAGEQLRRDIGRISQTRIDGMPTHVLAAALAAEGWRKLPPTRPREGVSVMDKTTTDRPPAPQRCGSCGGVINEQTGECRCSD
jgi:hypothetical protein